MLPGSYSGVLDPGLSIHAVRRKKSLGRKFPYIADALAGVSIRRSNIVIQR
jgi:hypothetical protein